VTDREKWKDIVRQVKAHSGLQCQWKKKKMYWYSDMNYVEKILVN
jgi:hypothetical protein